jgi:hypothetical protein
MKAHLKKHKDAKYIRPVCTGCNKSFQSHELYEEHECLGEEVAVDVQRLTEIEPGTDGFICR